MTGISSIIKEIEQYFLNLSQKGIMLSSRDYHIITEWIEKGLTKEQILQGIRNTFNNKDRSRIRNLSDCTEFVEVYGKENKKESEDTNVVNSESTDYLVHIINNFNTLISSQSNKGVLDYINEYSEKLKYFINNSKEDLFSDINDLEEQFFKNFPTALDQSELNVFESKKNEFITSGKDYINEKAKNKALNNFTKNLIINNYLEINPFEL